MSLFEYINLLAVIIVIIISTIENIIKGNKKIGYSNLLITFLLIEVNINIIQTNIWIESLFAIATLIYIVSFIISIVWKIKNKSDLYTDTK